MRRAIALVVTAVTVMGCELVAPVVEPFLTAESPPPVDVVIADASPGPVTEIPDAPEGGLASWCAPTPKYCHGWAPPAMLAAVPSFRYGDARYRVRVCRQDDASRCATVTVVSFCACGNKIIDLSTAAFDRLANHHLRGTVPVFVVPAGNAPASTLPPTSTAP